MIQKRKNRFTSSSNILREVPKTDKEEGLTKGGEGGRSRPVCSLVRRSVVRYEVTWWLPRWILLAVRGRVEVPVWWNGSRVIEILCSLPSRYDIRGGLTPTFSFFLASFSCSFLLCLSLPPASLSFSLPLSRPPNPPVTHSPEKISGPVHVSRLWNANANR